MVLISEGRLGRNGGQQVLLAGGAGANKLLSGLLPGDWLLQVVLLILAKESHVDENLDELWEASIAKSAADNGLCLGDVVSINVSNSLEVKECVFLPFGVACAVSVSVGDKVEANETSVVRLGSSHQINASDVHNLAILEVLGVVLQCK